MRHSKQKSQKVLATKTPLVSAIFDTALPLGLRDNGLHSTTEQAPRVNTGKHAPLSPYVIRLSHEHAPLVPSEQKEEDAIQALMDQLMQSDEEPEPAEPEVLVDFMDLMNQMREDLTPTTPDLRTPSRKSITPLYPETLPVHIEAIADTTLNIDAIFAQAPEIVEEPVLVLEATEPLEEITTAPEVSYHFALPAFMTNFRYRMTFSFIAISLLFVLPIHAMQEFSSLPAAGSQISAEGAIAADQLKEGGSALMASDFTFAADRFESAALAFSEIQKTVQEATKGIGLIASVIPQSSRALRTTDALVTTGESLSQVGRIFSLAIADINEHSTLTPTQKIQLFSTYLEQSEPHIALASEAVQNIDLNAIPENQQGTVKTLLDTVPALLTNISHLREYLDATYTILGGEEQKSYLLVFQNTAELRPTGGFMGSFAEIRIDQGRVEQVLVPTGGTYDIQGQVSEFLAPPEPLRLINSRWEFQDSNWFPDFRLSAEKMLDFHAASGGPTMDGVIAINSSVLPRILEATGPVLVDGKEFNAENVLFELQKRDESTADEPKALIGDLTNALVKKLEGTDAAVMLSLSDVLFSSLAQQEVQLYMKDEALAQTINHLRWNGAQLPYSFDTLQVIDTNIGGGKSDAVIDQNIDLQVQIGEDGSVVNTVTITKTHRGIASTVFQGVNNVDYVRAYVPRGSTLISATGFDERPADGLFETSTVPLTLDKNLEVSMQHYTQDGISLTDIWEENGFTVFGNWMQTKPGETETVSFQYSLPKSAISEDFSPDLVKDLRTRLGFKDISPYSLVLQKQSGAEGRTTNVSIAYPPSWTKAWNNLGAAPLGNQSTHVLQVLFER